MEKVLDSFEGYITFNGGITEYGVARSYISYVTGFFEEVLYEYGIKNELFIHKDKTDALNEIIKKRIKDFPKSKNKEKAFDADIVRLDKLITHTWKELDREGVYQEIDKDYTFGVQQIHLSCITCKLLITYGFKSKKLCSVGIDSYDKNKKTLSINSAIIPLTKEIWEMVDEYLEVRDYIVKRTETKCTNLFIIGNGNNCFSSNNTVNQAKFYKLLTDSSISASPECIAYTVITNMLKKGIDILTIHEMSGIGLHTCATLQREYYNENKRSMENIFKLIEGKVSLQVDITERLKCPNCGRKLDNNALNWVVVKYEGDEAAYVVCKECKGVNEEE